MCVGCGGGSPRERSVGEAGAERRAGGPILDTRTLLRQTVVDDMERMSQNDLKSNAIVYTYPCGVVDIICANGKAFMPPGWEAAEDYSQGGKAKPSPREKGKKADGEDLMRSMRRARANLRRLALANDFDYFVTLTLDPDRVDRYDPASIMKTMNRWLDNMVRRHGLRYILVPERHQDGAYHFHGFFFSHKFCY